MEIGNMRPLIALCSFFISSTCYSNEPTIIELAQFDGIVIELRIVENASFNTSGWLQVGLRNAGKKLIEKKIIASVKVEQCEVLDDSVESGLQSFIPKELQKGFYVVVDAIDAHTSVGLHSMYMPTPRVSPFLDSDLQIRAVTIVLRTDCRVGEQFVPTVRTSVNVRVALPTIRALDASVDFLRNFSNAGKVLASNIEDLQTICSYPYFVRELGVDASANLLGALVNISMSSSIRLTTLRTSIVDALSQCGLPVEIRNLYLKQLRQGDHSVIADIAKSTVLWHEEFVEPLHEQIIQTKDYSLRLKILQAIQFHRPRPVVNESFLVARLRNQGELAAELQPVSKAYFEVMALLGDPSLIDLLARHLDNKTGIPSGIGDPVPFEPRLPRLRLCDCAHDAIVELSGANLDARIACAYKEIGVSNSFDPSVLRRLVRPKRHGDSQDEEEIMTDIIAKLTEEVRCVRDKMIEYLKADLARTQ